MRKCGECGFPAKFERFFTWWSDGTITSTDRSRGTAQIAFLESGELESLFDNLGGTIGISIDGFMIEAQKQVGKVLNENLPVRHIKRVPANRFLRPQWLARFAVAAIRGDIAGLGDGRVALESYRAGESMVLRFHDPCVAPMLMGGAVGMYESLEEMPCATYEYEFEENGDLVLRLGHGEEKPVCDERLYLEEPRRGTGDVHFMRCAKCGVPLDAAAALEWDLETGIIRNRLTGRREVIVAVQSIAAILRELERELGEEVSGVLFEAQKSLTLERFAAERPDWEAFLKDLALRGLGYPDSISTGETVSVEISNAYNQGLYAAKLCAAFELLNGVPSGIRWERSESGDSAYTISAA